MTTTIEQKLYVLTGSWFHERDVVLGVYSSAELAEAAKAACIADREKRHLTPRDSYDVEEFERDVTTL